jgi:O-antigen/teichoic acid export membrane protein
MVGLASFFWMLRNFRLGKPDFKQMKGIFLKSLTYAGVVFLFPLYERFDLLLVESLGNPQELGYYTGPWRIAISLIPFFVVICNIFLSEALATSNEREFRANTSLAFFLCFAVGLPIAVAIPFVGSDILTFIYDSDYRSVNSLFTVFCFSIVLEIFLLVFGLQVLMLKGKSNQLSLALLATIISGLVAGYAGMQAAGIVGLAVGAFLARLLLALWLVWESSKILGYFPSRDFATIFAASIGMACSLYMMRDLSVWILIASGALIYAVLILLLNRNKLQLLKKLKRS